MRLRSAAGVLSNNAHSHAQVLRRLRGGDLHIPGGPYDAEFTLEPDPQTAALLLAHPEPDLEARIWQPAPDASGAAAAAAAASAEAAARLRTLTRAAWRTAAADALAAAAAQMMREQPPLALKRCTAPVLTRGADSLHRVFTGPVDCSAKLSLYNPLQRCNEEMDADELASALGDLRRGGVAAEADDRPPEEILVVCIDVSKSMSGLYNAEDDHDSDKRATRRG